LAPLNRCNKEVLQWYIKTKEIGKNSSAIFFFKLIAEGVILHLLVGGIVAAHV